MKIVLGIIMVLLILNLVIILNLLNKQNKAEVTADTAEISAKFPYLAQRILVEKPNDILINFLPLRIKLREYVAQYGSSFAFYFEYLPTGVSIGVNEKDDFVAASLIKLPVVMAFYHQAEKEGSGFVKRVVKIESDDIDKEFGDLWRKGIGYEISLEEAARLTLVESDNTAVNVLARNVLRQDFDDVYEGLDIDIKSDEQKTYINPKNYSSILKALYFSAVLKKEESQKVLELLSHSSFDDKLRAPLPPNIVVANKFGVYKNDGFQDCGIVYVPKRQYILCMMSKSDEAEAGKRMVKLSELVFEYVRDVNSK